MLAAHRAGMKRVVLPSRNKRDVEADIPDGVQRSLSIRFAESLEDVLAEAFDTDGGEPLLSVPNPHADELKSLRSKL